MKKCKCTFRHALGGVAVLGLLIASVQAGPTILGKKAQQMEQIPANTPIRTFYNDAAGSVAADVLTGAGAIVYLAYNSHGSTYAQFNNMQPTGTLISAPNQMSAEYAGSAGVVGYDLQIFRSSLDPGGLVALADIDVELWDGDPLGAVDTAAGGYLNSPIPGTLAHYSGIPPATIATLKASFPVVAISTPSNRVWMTVTSDACRLGWIHSFVLATTGSNGGIDSWVWQLDNDGSTGGAGGCCFDGSACDTDGPADDGIGAVFCASDLADGRGHCSDGAAEAAQWVGFGAPCGADPTTSSCSNFVSTIFAQGDFALALIPTGLAPVAAGAVAADIDGTTISMNAGGVDVVLDVVATNWDPAGAGTLIKAYQAALDSSGYASGQGAPITVAQIACTTDDECVVALGGACSITKGACTVSAGTCPLDPIEFCAGPKCGMPADPTICQNAHINTARADFLMAHTNPLPALDVSTPDYRWAAALQPNSDEVSAALFIPLPDPGFYLGSLALHVPSDCKGTYEIGFFASGSSLVQSNSAAVPLMGINPGKIVCRTGQCCDVSGDPFVCVTDAVTQDQCESIIGGTFDSNKTCADACACTDAASCDDGDACTVDVCEANGQCSNTDIAIGADECCDTATAALTNKNDLQVCTDDICSDGGNRGSAQNPGNTGSCNDSNPCSFDDTCDGSGDPDDLACRGTLIEDPPISCADIDDCPPGSTGCSGGVCECKLSVDLVCGTLVGDACVNAGDKVVFNIDKKAGQTVCGAQFSVSYDPSCLSFNSINPGGGNFSFELDERVDTGAGTIFYAVGVDPFGGAAACSGGNDTLAAISFTKIGDCNSCSLDCSGGANPLDTVMSNTDGNFIEVSPGPGDTVIDTPLLTADFPGSQKTNVDCDGNTAYPTWDPPTCSSDCGDCTVGCVGTHEGGDPAPGSGGEHSIGLTTYVCTASSTGPCASTIGGGFTVEVNDQTALDVTVQLSPIMAGNVERCITFELYSDCVQAPFIHRVTMQFGGLRDLIGHFTESIKIPTAGQWTCITAKDQLHSLRATEFLSCDGGVYSAVFKGDPFFGGNWLIGGNLDGWKKEDPNASHDVIDILDFGQFVAQYLAGASINTDCGTEGPHADINGDGVVDALDFSFIMLNFLEHSKDACCVGSAAARTPARTEISVRELRQLGMADLAVADLNKDGLVNTDDMSAFLAGEVPTKGQIRRNQGGLRGGK